MQAYSIAFIVTTLLEKVTIRLWGKLADQLEFAWLNAKNTNILKESFIYSYSSCMGKEHRETRF